MTIHTGIREDGSLMLFDDGDIADPEYTLSLPWDEVNDLIAEIEVAYREYYKVNRIKKLPLEIPDPNRLNQEEHRW